MTGQHAFDQMITGVTTDFDFVLARISQDDFELWQKDVVWDALHGIRYGQSFCNRFGITDNLLYYTTWPCEQIDEYIKKNYVNNN
jgi:hypothetical protein